jgi:lipoyl(octanoyl) transferase
VNTDLSHFDLIVPCGIRDRGITSLERSLGRTVELRLVEDAIVSSFGDVFHAGTVEASHSADQVITG